MWADFGLEFTYVGYVGCAKNVERAIQKNTRMVFIETPTNPLMALTRSSGRSADLPHQQESRPGGRQHLHVAVLPAADRVRGRHGGAFDYEVSERAQRWTGRSGGVHRPEQAEKLAFLQKAAGAILSPFECWLILRGVKTLAVRMSSMTESGRKVAAFLAGHKKVKKVFYPGIGGSSAARAGEDGRCRDLGR